jgi:membrane protease YdiL (CAAX protease family)
VPTAVPPARGLDDSILRLLPASLREPYNPLRAIVTGWLLSLVGSLVLAAVSRSIAPDLGSPQFPPLSAEVMLFLLVVFAPAVETLIMAAVLELMLRLRVPPGAAILLSAFGWGIAHSSQAAGWGLVIWWPFLIFSTLYVTWSKRSLLAALAIVFAVHALQNLGPALLLLYEAA